MPRSSDMTFISVILSYKLNQEDENVFDNNEVICTSRYDNLKKGQAYKQRQSHNRYTYCNSLTSLL